MGELRQIRLLQAALSEVSAASQLPLPWEAQLDGHTRASSRRDRRSSACLIHGRTLGFQLSREPWQNHLAEDTRVGPDTNLPPEMPALRIDPRIFRHIATVEQLIDI